MTPVSENSKLDGVHTKVLLEPDLAGFCAGSTVGGRGRGLTGRLQVGRVVRCGRVGSTSKVRSRSDENSAKAVDLAETAVLNPSIPQYCNINDNATRVK